MSVSITNYISLTSIVSSTLISPDMSLGRSVSRVFANFLFCFWIKSIYSNIGSHSLWYFFKILSLGSNNFLDQQICLELENRKLTETRDILLPKLMSGEIRVDDTIEVEEM